MTSDKDAFEWQTGIWDQMSDFYGREIDTRFVPVIERLLAHANLKTGHTVLDLGSGTGAATFAAAKCVGESGKVTAVDISPRCSRSSASA